MRSSPLNSMELPIQVLLRYIAFSGVFMRKLHFKVFLSHFGTLEDTLLGLPGLEWLFPKSPYCTTLARFKEMTV